MKRKELFLRWCVATFTVSALIGLALWMNWSQSTGLSMIGKGIILVVFVVFVKAAVNAGAICWAVDRATESVSADPCWLISPAAHSFKQDLRRLRHQADHISFAANECPYFGLIGALGGIWLMSKAGLSDLDAAHIQQVSSTLLAGVGLAFLPTITGVFCRSVLMWMHHNIVHRISYTLEDL